MTTSSSVIIGYRRLLTPFSTYGLDNRRSIGRRRWRQSQTRERDMSLAILQLLDRSANRADRHVELGADLPPAASRLEERDRATHCRLVD